MNKYTTTICSLLLAATATAQDYSKMSGQLRRFVHDNSATAKAKSFTGNNSEKLIMLVQGDEEALQGQCIRHQGDLHIVSMPVNNIAALSEDSRIRRMEVSFTKPTTLNYEAASRVGATDIWNGKALPKAFDGTGVLVGDVDIAHDYTHPAFRSLKDGRLRIVRTWDLLDVKEGYTPDGESNIPLGMFLNDTTEILRKGCSVDSETLNHGTHTTATAAGSGWGTTFSGMAPEADLYLTSVTCSDNTYLIPEDMQEYYTQELTLLAFQNIYDYADSIGKPCVINYSMGSTPDITDNEALLQSYMQRMLGPGKVFVASAGNNGINYYNYYQLTKKDEACGGMLTKRLTSGSEIDIRIKTKGALTLIVKGHDTSGNTTSERRLTLDCVKDGDYVTSPSGTLKGYDFNTFCDKDMLDNLNITVYPGICGMNEEYVGYDVFIIEGDKTFDEGRYTIEAVNEADAVTDLYSQENFVRACDTADGSLAGWEQGGTILSPGSLPSVITVGATSWHNSVKNIDGKDIRFPAGEGGERASFSSVGPTLDGSMKPDITAPGNLLSSAMNSFTEEPYIYNFTGKTMLGDKAYYYIAESGTSMAAPVVTGTIALWLQADPTLTTERIKDIFAKTARHTDTTLSYPNYYYGYGEIDAYAGLLEVLGITDVKGLSKQLLHGATVRPAADGSISVTLDAESASPLSCRLYSTDGRLIKSLTLPQGRTAYRIDTEGFKGIMAVQIDGCGSTLIRL